MHRFSTLPVDGAAERGFQVFAISLFLGTRYTAKKKSPFLYGTTGFL